MAAGLLVVSALVLGLAPGGLPLDPVDPVDPAPLEAGPVTLAAGEGVGLATDLPLPLSVETALTPCPTCPAIQVQAGPGATAPQSPPAAKPSSAGGGPLAAFADPEPEAVAAGSSLLAAGLTAAAWLARSSLGLFSRLEDGELARHPLRRQALDYIQANPGASLQDVRRALGVAWGTAVYHLGRMERAGLVAVRHVAGRRGHWPLGQAPAVGALAPTGQALARLVRDQPGLSQNELARRAGIGAPAACKQLRRLESAGFVSAERAGRTCRYVATPQLAGVLS